MTATVLTLRPDEQRLVRAMRALQGGTWLAARLLASNVCAKSSNGAAFEYLVRSKAKGGCAFDPMRASEALRVAGMTVRFDRCARKRCSKAVFSKDSGAMLDGRWFCSPSCCARDCDERKGLGNG